MILDFKRTTDFKHLVESMTHEGIIREMSKLLEIGVPPEYIMSELKPADYQQADIAIALENAGADPVRIVHLVGPNNLLDYWKPKDAARFCNSRVADVIMKDFKHLKPETSGDERIDLLLEFLREIVYEEKTIASPLLEDCLWHYIKYDPKYPHLEENPYAYSIRETIESYVGIFLSAGLDADAALALGNWKNDDPSAFQILLEAGANVYTLIDRMGNKSKLVLYGVFKNHGIELEDYKDLVIATGNLFEQCMSSLLRSGADPQWLADQVTDFRLSNVSTMKELLLHGADFNSMKDRVSLSVLLNEHQFLADRHIQVDWITEIKKRLNPYTYPSSIPCEMNNRVLYQNLSWVASFMPTKTYLNEISSTVLAEYFFQIWNLYQNDPEMQNYLFQKVIIDAGRDDIDRPMDFLLKKYDFDGFQNLIENGSITAQQLGTALKQYLQYESQDSYRNLCRAETVFSQLKLIQKYFPYHFDIQKYFSKNPSKEFQTAMVLNINKVLSCDIKFCTEDLLRNADVTNADRVRCIIALGERGYDVNSCLKQTAFASHGPFDEYQIERLIELDANRDLLAYICYTCNTDISAEQLKQIFAGPTLWTDIARP